MNKLQSSTISFNCFVIIESLTNDGSTRMIYNELIRSTDKTGLHIIYEQVKTEEDLGQVLQKILDTPNMLPLLQFSTHGNLKGLKLINGFVSWKVLFGYLVKLNIKSKNGLPIVMAACYGIFAAFASTDFERSPFAFMMGPQSEIEEAYLDGLLVNFYKSLIEYRNFSIALADITNLSNNKVNPFIILTPHYFIDRLRKNIVEEINSGRARHKLLDEYKKK